MRRRERSRQTEIKRVKKRREEGGRGEGEMEGEENAVYRSDGVAGCNIWMVEVSRKETRQEERGGGGMVERESGKRRRKEKRKYMGYCPVVGKRSHQ